MQETHPMNLMTNLLQSVGDFKAALQKKLACLGLCLSLKPEYCLCFFKLRNNLSTIFHVSTSQNLKL